MKSSFKMLGTAFVSVWLLNFRSTPFMTARKRELLSDYALVLGVSLMAFVANEFFGDVPSKRKSFRELLYPVLVLVFRGDMPLPSQFFSVDIWRILGIGIQWTANLCGAGIPTRNTFLHGSNGYSSTLTYCK